MFIQFAFNMHSISIQYPFNMHSICIQHHLNMRVGALINCCSGRLYFSKQVYPAQFTKRLIVGFTVIVSNFIPCVVLQQLSVDVNDKDRQVETLLAQVEGDKV